MNNSQYERTQIPLTEKYRPSTIDKVILPELQAAQIKCMIESGNIPHLILTGSTGTGKTTTAFCIARETLGDKMKDAFKELNASDDRGIKVVNGPMKEFCQKKISGIRGKKIILLDEADNMTTKQQALIGTLMNTYEHNTVFIFTCNSSGKISEQIQSKCVILRYSRLEVVEMQKILVHICKQEEFTYKKEGIVALITTSQGDMRNAINNLHAVHHSLGEITDSHVAEICDQPDPYIVGQIIKKCLDKDFTLTIKYLKTLKDKGYSSQDILQGLIEFIKYDDLSHNVLSEKNKIVFMNQISKTKIIISSGIDSDLQLHACLRRIISLLP